MKLWKVTCRGMLSGLGTSHAHGIAYVVAENSDLAYRQLRTSLNKRDLGFTHERELGKVELIAAEGEYPECGITLYLQEQQK